MRVLLSIKPTFADKIFSKEKRFEYRKTTFKRQVSTVVVYVTQPIGRIVGEFTIGKILQGTPSELWEATKAYSGISEDFFCEYFSGRTTGYAIQVLNPVRYSPIINPYKSGSFTAPQSFHYIKE